MKPLYDFLHRPFGGVTSTSAIPSEPLSIPELKKAIKQVERIQKSNTFIELLKNLESFMKKGKIHTIKVMQNDLIPEGELLISYNLKSK